MNPQSMPQGEQQSAYQQAMMAASPQPQGGAPNPNSLVQSTDNSQAQIQQGLQAVGQFLSAIGHPLAQTFNQMHGFVPGQQQGQPQQPQQQQGQQPQLQAQGGQQMLSQLMQAKMGGQQQMGQMMQ